MTSSSPRKPRSSTSSSGSTRDIVFLDSWVSDPARGSGSAMAIRGLAGGLRSLGHRVETIRPSRGAGNLPGRIAYNLALPFRFRPSDFDLVVGFDLDGWLLGARDGTPRVVSLKGIAADEMRFESGRSRLRMGAYAVLEGRSARRADRVIVPSDYSRGVAIEAYGLPPERVAVVAEGIDLAEWKRAARETPVPAKRRGGEDGQPPSRTGASRPPTILSVARQYARKNTRTLLRAMTAVVAAVPAARLRIVGGGPELPALRRQARRRRLGSSVTLLGELSNRNDIYQEYLQADVFCLPTRQEGFGIVFLEAMAAGLPIVASDAAAVPEVVPAGEAGILVPPLDARALSGALLRLLRDPSLRDAYGAAGRRHVESYDWPRVARLFLAATRA